MVELADNQPQTWGSPTEEELAAIVAAIEQVWPKDSVNAINNPALNTPIWRFSGRWWH